MHSHARWTNGYFGECSSFFGIVMISCIYTFHSAVSCVLPTCERSCYLTRNIPDMLSSMSGTPCVHERCALNVNIFLGKGVGCIIFYDFTCLETYLFPISSSDGTDRTSTIWKERKKHTHFSRSLLSSSSPSTKIYGCLRKPGKAVTTKWQKNCVYVL